MILITGPIKNFIGLSTDTKPTAGVPAGSGFFESDTRKPYIFDGTSWTVGVYPGKLEAGYGC